MKQKSINKIDYYLFIYLFFYFFQIIKAAVPDDECSLGCKLVDKKCDHNSTFLETCPSYCVPDLVEGKCYKCEGFYSTIYYIFSTDGNHTCGLGGSCGNNKLVFNTRQCVTQCYGQGTYSLYEMDGICYTKEECGEANRKIVSTKKCDCKYLFSRKKEVNKKKFSRHCYGEGELCGPEHTQYDSDTRICGNCGAGKLKKYETRPKSTNILRCSTLCKPKEFEYNGYCLDSCPATTFKYYDPDRGYQCLNSCSGYIIGNECVPSCDSHYIYENNTCKSTCDRPFFIYEETFTNPISKSGWTATADFDDDGYEPKLAIDDNINTFWHTKWRTPDPDPPNPHWIIVDMKRTYNVSEFQYLTRQNKWYTGILKTADLYLSSDGQTWGQYVLNGQFENTKKNRSWQNITISPPRACRYFKLVSRKEINGGPHACAAELGFKVETLRHCIKSCISPKYIDGDYCKTSCTSGYYISTNNDNIRICVPYNGCHVKSGDRAPRYCYKSCTESGWPYYIGTTCYKSCPNGTSYHEEGKFECLSNCPPNYYLDGNTCYCSGLYAYTYTTLDNKRGKKCYADEEECKTAGYFYRKGNECLKQCAPNFELELDNTASNFTLKRCYNNKEECKSNGYYFYNSYKQKCWSACPYDMWSIELDNEGKPLEDITNST